MTLNQSEKAKQFRALHEAPDAFVIANVWDGGSARMMAAIGFAALATSSGASAGLLGRRDGRVTREEALAQARVICDATDLPVSADLEKGFGDAPEIVAETIRLAAEAGLVGCSIEDASGRRRPRIAGDWLTQRACSVSSMIRSFQSSDCEPPTRFNTPDARGASVAAKAGVSVVACPGLTRRLIKPAPMPAPSRARRACVARSAAPRSVFRSSRWSQSLR